jgi:hypothetical protein
LALRREAHGVTRRTGQAGRAREMAAASRRAPPSDVVNPVQNGSSSARILATPPSSGRGRGNVSLSAASTSRRTGRPQKSGSSCVMVVKTWPAIGNWLSVIRCSP